jgi:polyisoprenoid-binding protein YceI
MSSRTKILTAVLVAVALLVVGGGLWWYLSDDAPEKVSLESATEGLEADGGSTSSTAGADGGASSSQVDGAWTVDDETGEFDFQSATGSFAGFRIDEEIAQIGAKEAVGRTGGVSGTMEISDGEVTSVDVTVDMAALTTDESRRDDRVHESLQTDQFPTATFTLDEPIDLGAAAEDGSPVSTTAEGELTIHGVTQPVELTVEAQVVDGTIVVVGSTRVNLAEYGVTAPTAPMVLSIAEEATIELQLLFVKT